MTNHPGNLVLVFACLVLSCAAVCAQNFNENGVTLLRDLNTNLNGSGVRVGQPEAPEDVQGFDWQVSPGYCGHSVSNFTYFSNGATTNTFPNLLGGESSHADSVGWNFYGTATGVASNVMHVDNYNAVYFVQEQEFVLGGITNYTVTLPSSNIEDAVVNQSFIFANFVSNNYVQVGSNEEAAIDSAYDNYADQYSSLFVSGCGNGSPTYANPPSTSYNGISVGVYEGGGSSIGPTVDNGRCKPDINAIAPGGSTSFASPYVAGAAAILLQAGMRGDGGSIGSATNMMTLKALLLNGAVKPANWANLPPAPLDFRYGAGILNVFNSYEELAAGKHGYTVSTSVSLNAPHPPATTSASVPVLSGWDMNTNTSGVANDEVNHYFFNVTNSSGSGAFTLVTTLVWNRHQNKTAINHLELFLYNAADSNLVGSSTSVVDNVQHVFIPQLPQGRYDLQVWKAGGGVVVSLSEPYALAWQIFSDSLHVTQSGANTILSWPAFPAGFAVAATPGLNPPVTWSTNNLPAPVYSNGLNVVSVSATNPAQFYRLQTPNF